MRLIDFDVELLPQTGYTEEDICRMIELAGRTCYKSENKITESSAKEFVNRMRINKHYAMLEHGTVYLHIPDALHKLDNHCVAYFAGENSGKYSKVSFVDTGNHTMDVFATTNLRVLVENNIYEQCKEFICQPTIHHERRYTARFICDRAISHELVRHRAFSFAQESQRFCNYSKDKFDNEITFIRPVNLNIPTGMYINMDGDWVDTEAMCIKVSEPTEEIGTFLHALNTAEMSYQLLINKGWKPQDARAVLPNATKTEVVMTGFASDWDHFFELRCAENVQPEMRILANKLKSFIYGDKTVQSTDISTKTVDSNPTEQQ